MRPSCKPLLSLCERLALAGGAIAAGVLRQQRGALAQGLVLALQQSLKQAQHLVIVAPLWWGHLPARLKGLLDRTLLSGFAFRYQKGKALPERLLAGKTARLLLTMDSPLWYYRWWLGSPVERTLDKPVLGLCGIRLTHRQHLGPVHTSGERERQRWLGRAAAAARSDAQRLARRRT